MMSEFGGDAKIPDLWRMSGPLESCPKDVKEQMMIGLDDIRENYENLKAKVVSHTTNKTEQARRGSGPRERQRTRGGLERRRRGSKRSDA